jgi:hypothetical protein
MDKTEKRSDYCPRFAWALLLVLIVFSINSAKLEVDQLLKKDIFISFWMEGVHDL